MSLWSAAARRMTWSKGRVVAHILDPSAGYSNRELRVGKDIAAETVRRLGDSGEVFVVVAYDRDVPTATVCKRAQWLRARANQEASNQDAATTVWRKRAELEIG